MDKRYIFGDLISIVEQLRSENGCPWDLKQTHGSLKRCMVEEAYEVVEGIRLLEETGAADNLTEELGDVLLQVVMHSQIGGEAGLFDHQDVIQGICEKMIRRHPHVFGDRAVKDAQAVALSWEELKKQEKKTTPSNANPLKEVPQCLPALSRTEKVQKYMEHLYADAPDVQKSLRDATAGLSKIATGIGEKELETTYAKILWDLTNAARKQHLHPEQILADFVEKMIANRP